MCLLHACDMFNNFILPFVYSSVEKKHEQLLLLLETDRLEYLGSLGVAILAPL